MNPFNYLVVNTTNRCNTICKYCFQSAESFKQGNDFLTYDIFKKIIDFCLPHTGKNRIVHFTGGEPLLNEDFFSMLQYAEDKDYIVRIQTNGLLLNDCGKGELELLSKPKVSVKISLDGATPEQHHYLRQPGTYERVIEAIARMTQINNAVGVKTCVHKKNIDHFEELLEFCVKNGVAGFSYNVIRNEGNALHMDSKVCDGIDEMEIVKRLVPLFNKERYRYLLNGNQIAMYYFARGYRIASSSQFYIDYDGKVYSYQECLPEQYIGDLKLPNWDKQFNAELSEKLRYIKSTTQEILDYVKANLYLPTV